MKKVLILVAVLLVASVFVAAPKNFILGHGLYGDVVYDLAGNITGYEGMDFYLFQASTYYEKPMTPNELNAYTFDGKFLFFIPVFGRGWEFILRPVDNIVLSAGLSLLYNFLPGPYLYLTILL
ncbi:MULTISPECIES: hypothetical protein [unclassified Mesotoga]|jgi:hypothetical protein|uniref:hypothetical protein n=1 Tax=unclassified Mesotoga TaxID=1184398 RepID=UPI000E8B3B8A|nr:MULTISPECIES: hypothetical protein [unclassified Mesotoga]MDD3461364.1 hypothetical protein [Mesotoga sp.]HAY99161.1 hypothetical protein [Mesotoga sp.]